MDPDVLRHDAGCTGSASDPDNSSSYDNYWGPIRCPASGSRQNTYAQLAAQNGIQPLVYLAANLVLWIVLYRVRRGTRDPALAHVAVSFFALAVSFWFFSLTLDLVETEISWVILAVGVVLWGLYRREGPGAQVLA
jgi:hypothetical protein